MFRSSKSTNRSILALLLLSIPALAFVLLSTTVGFAQLQSQELSATALTSSSSFTSATEKYRISSPSDPSSTSQVEGVSVIVTFDTSFDANMLKALTGGQIIHRYQKLFNGVAIVAPEDKINDIAVQEGVTGVYRDEILQLYTDTSPAFTGAITAWEQLGGQQSAGEGVVIGMLDTGIWPEHPSFSDPDAFGHSYPAPPGGPYLCDFGSFVPGDTPFTCNNKLVGAYRFMATYDLFNILLPGEFPSARDDSGHGTHTTATAAGNGNVAANIFGAELELISGIAPRAHIITYKICGDIGCYSSDAVAAVEQAISDGVDVINFAISGGSNPYSDIVELAFLSAYENGIFVAAGAGNDGPGPNTVNHRGPWVTTVAASSHDRTFASALTLTGLVSGTSVTTETIELAGTSVTSGHSADVALAASLGDASCLAPFAAGTWTNHEIVICGSGQVSGAEKSFNVAAGGAGGMILYNSVPHQVLTADNHFVPTIHLQDGAGAALLDFIATHTNVTGAFSQGSAATGQSDVMAFFSSRGGPGQTLGISKPDITAPGVQILAGHTPLPATSKGGAPGQLFRLSEGTSTSSAQVAGAAALLKALHPDWTPGQIQSALMTTAHTGIVKEDGVTPADVFDYGSGRLDLHRAGNPGLTISASAQDFIIHQNDLWNVNYPSLYIPYMPDAMIITRTVLSELTTDTLWQVIVESPPDLVIIVTETIRVPAGESASFTMIIDARKIPVGAVRQATLFLERDDEDLFLEHDDEALRFPITIRRMEPVVTLGKGCQPATFAIGETADCTITISNTGFETATISMADFVSDKVGIVPGSVVGANQHGSQWLYLLDLPLAGAGPPGIAVALGESPFGYLPLATLGAVPNVTLTNESVVNFTVDPFIYAGVVYTNAGMVSNGYALAGNGDANDVQAINQVLPDPNQPNNLLAPFWTDLNPAAGGLYYAYSISDTVSLNKWIVFEWEEAPNSGDGQVNSFQVWIGTNGVEDISFTYGVVSAGNNGLLTVGAENSAGNSGHNYYVNGIGTPVSAGNELNVTTVAGAPGETYFITYSVKGREAGKWINCAGIISDVFFGFNIACFSGEVSGAGSVPLSTMDHQPYNIFLGLIRRLHNLSG